MTTKSDYHHYLKCSDNQTFSINNTSISIQNSKNLTMSTAKTSLLSKQSIKFSPCKSRNLINSISVKPENQNQLDQSIWEDNLLSLDEIPLVIQQSDKKIQLQQQQNTMSFNLVDDSLLLMDICAGCNKYSQENQIYHPLKYKINKLKAETIFSFMFNQRIIYNINTFKQKLRRLLICKSIPFKLTQINSFSNLCFENMNYICHHRFGIIIDNLLQSDNNRIRTIFNKYQSTALTTIQIKSKVLKKKAKIYWRVVGVLQQLFQRLQKWDNYIITYWDLYLIRDSQQCERFLELSEQIFQN